MPDRHPDVGDRETSDTWPPPSPERQNIQTVILVIAGAWFLLMFLVLLGLLYAGLRGAGQD